MNNASLTPQQAAREFSRKALEEDYVPQALHVYTDSEGHILYWRIRLKHADGRKWIRPMYQDVDGQYHLGEPPALKDKPKPLYGLHLLSEATDAIVWIVEGEYAADALNKFFKEKNANNAHTAITSGSASSADTADWQVLLGRRCIIWPDHDEAGLNYAQQIALQLAQINCTVKILDISLLGLAEGGDCVDWLAKYPSATVNDMLVLYAGLQQETEECIITRLATLSPLEYDRARKEAANALQIRPATLDSMIKESRMEGRQERTQPFAEVVPWHEAIQPAELLHDINRTICRFIVCQPETAHAATLWIAMTWFIDAVHIAPLAVITAPEKRCGKSQLLFLLGRLVNRPLPASNITPAALFRSIDAWQPTLLIDEADAFMRENEELRGLLNCGHTRESAYTIRVVGEEHTPKAFFVWGAKALAGIGHLADTLMDRAIVLALRRKLGDENVERLRHSEAGLFDTLAAKLARFAQDYADKVKQSKPELPSSLNDRAQDNWEPLLAIAEIAGEDWSQLARLAALKLSGEEKQSQSISIELLADIQEIFESKGVDRISSVELITALCFDEEKPWATYNRGVQIKPRQVASRLKEFDIISNTIRFGYMTAKGYLKVDFADAFERYLASSSPTVSVTP
jgi:hypothetical protein